MKEEKVRPLKLAESESVRIDKLDKAEYQKLKDFTGIPIVKLFHFALPLLKKKYKYKEEEKGEQNV